MSIIAFSGIDGAGKSTQIELLKDYYEVNQQKAIVIWARGGYTSGMNHLKKLLRKSNTKKMPSSGRSKEREQAFNNKIVRKLWLVLAIFDLFWLYGIQVRWLQLKRHHIIFDRFLEDTLIDFQLNFPQEKVKDWWSWKLLVALVPSPNTHYILLIPVKESQRRSVLKNEPFPDSPKVLESRVAVYKDLIKSSGNYVYIDCMNTIDVVFNKVKESLKR